MCIFVQMRLLEYRAASDRFLMNRLYRVCIADIANTCMYVKYVMEYAISSLVSDCLHTVHMQRRISCGE